MLITTASHEPSQELARTIAKLRLVVEGKDYTAPQSSLVVPFDSRIQEAVLHMVDRKKTTELKYVIVVGIGGSNLGTKAVYDALLGFADSLKPHRFPQLIFLDTVDPEFLSVFSSFFQTAVHREEEVVISIVSKSGGTTETLVNAELALDLLRQKGKGWKSRCVITTEPQSKLWKEAMENEIDVLGNPPMVGGRYSVFSPVGLFPLALCGIDVEQLLRGAREMGKRCIEPTSDNPAVRSSVALYEAMQKGIVIHDTFLFHPELESLGKWYRQLTGESLGKEGKGIFPTVSIGSNDLHSMVQLYLGGPANIYTTFVYSKNSSNLQVPSHAVFRLSEQFAGRPISAIMQAITQGTMKAYQARGLLYTECCLTDISAYELGQFMQWRMVEIMLLAQMLQVNAFDQPQVELYKTETKKILAIK
jgi:glucose-6-phosphate isomerase